MFEIAAGIVLGFFAILAILRVLVELNKQHEIRRDYERRNPHGYRRY